MKMTKRMNLDRSTLIALKVCSLEKNYFRATIKCAPSKWVKPFDVIIEPANVGDVGDDDDDDERNGADLAEHILRDFHYDIRCKLMENDRGLRVSWANVFLVSDSWKYSKIVTLINIKYTYHYYTKDVILRTYHSKMEFLNLSLY